MRTMAYMDFTAAEYDRGSNTVIAVRRADGNEVSTGAPTVLGAETEWLPVEVRYPAGYDVRFNRLLRGDQLEFRYDPDANVVAIEFPDADFSPQAVRGILIEMVKDIANNELRPTDWYFVRQMETGTPVPPEVRARRQEIRDTSAQYELDIVKTKDSELLDYVITFGDRPGRAVPRGETPKGADGRLWVTDATAPDQQGSPLEPVDEEE